MLEVIQYMKTACGSASNADNQLLVPIPHTSDVREVGWRCTQMPYGKDRLLKQGTAYITAVHSRASQSSEVREVVLTTGMLAVMGTIATDRTRNKVFMR